MARRLAAWAGVLGFLAVAFGAFGAHALKDRLTPESLAIFQTGVQYQMAHALALLGLAALSDRIQFPAVGRLFVTGVIIFSGSLYLLALTGDRWLGAITPFGGLCFLAGWALIAVGAMKKDNGTNP